MIGQTISRYQILETLGKHVGYDRHWSKYRVMEIVVSGRQDIAFGLFNLPTYRESAYLLCGTTPPFEF